MKNTTLILHQLRLLMLNSSVVGPDLSAYIVPYSDAHHNIRRADCDQRLAFVSGFDGSSGTAIITNDTALLWTDARYFIQAENQLDENWTLMKEGVDGTPTQAEWLTRNFLPGSLVGIDPAVYSKGQWDAMSSSLTDLTLTPVDRNLVDLVWGADRPPRPTFPISQLGIEFAGKSVPDKLQEIRTDAFDGESDTGPEFLLITELDEIAWLLNLRGTDLPQAPTFFAFAIMSKENVTFFIDDQKISLSIRNSLITDTNGAITFHPYDSVYSELSQLVNSTTGKFIITKNCNYALTSIIGEDRIASIRQAGPIALRKTIKNPVEVDGMRRALIRDAAVLCQFYSWLEEAMMANESVTEVSAANVLLQFKQSMPNFVGLSFKTISGSGPNGAIIHYFPTNETDRALSTDEMYLIDSGSHYFDGTTDITRTFHFGTPTDFQRDCYTRVLKGQIAIATSHFPTKIQGSRIDSFARSALWEVGLDYGHGTGHGVGAYLNVGEGPQSVGASYNPADPGLQENMIISNEPGYYDKDNFGIRLENVVRIATEETMPGFLKIEDLTFVPYQHKLIKLDLLSAFEISYLNDYQEKCRQLTGAYIIDNNLGTSVYDWLVKETMPFTSKYGDTRTI